MKKRAIKNFGHALIFGVSIVFLSSCGKDALNSPSSLQSVEGNQAAVTAKAAFTAQTEGLTTQKTADQKGIIRDYLLYIPTGYNIKKDYKWPIVISLHGTGEIGTNVNVLKNVGLPKVVAGKPFIMVAPQCRSSWWNNASLDAFYKEVTAKYNVDLKRVYLTGLSMGGFGTWDWSVVAPDKFAALIPISGGGDPKRAAVIKNIPVWAFHNLKDPTVNVWGTLNMVDALKAVGGNIKSTIYNSASHDAWTATYANPAVYTWMLAQHK